MTTKGFSSQIIWIFCEINYGVLRKDFSSLFSMTGHCLECRGGCEEGGPADAEQLPHPGPGLAQRLPSRWPPSWTQAICTLWARERIARGRESQSGWGFSSRRRRWWGHRGERSGAVQARGREQVHLFQVLGQRGGAQSQQGGPTTFFIRGNQSKSDIELSKKRWMQ